MSKGEMLAKMAERSQSLQMGNGGKPTIEWTDVAGGLAFVGDKFAAAMFELLHAPGLRNWRHCDELIASRQFEAWRERAERLIDAQIANAISKRTGEGVQHANLLMQGARTAMWPQLHLPQWGHIRTAVVAELRIRPVCEICKGTRHVMQDSKRVPCSACNGGGRERISDRQRAIAIKIDISNFVRHWRPVYEWTYNLVNDCALAGSEQFQPNE